MPLKQLHPQAEEKIAFILSSTDRGKALEDLVAGKYDDKALPAVEKNVKMIKAHADVVASAGIGGTPAYYINGVFVNGANMPIIEKLLVQKGELKK
jgi:thiol:disulfide interchange protein DsbC